MGKGAKVGDLQFMPAVVEAMKPFPTGPAGYLIPNDEGARLSQQAADQAIARAAQRAGIDKQVSAHWLRHCLATTALANGPDLPQVQKGLGHAALATTQRYLPATSRARRRDRRYRRWRKKGPRPMRPPIPSRGRQSW